MNGMAAADKMFAILDAPEPKRGSRVIEADRISFACRGVGYSYDGERTVLSDVDFDAAAGSFTGIVGESGSGKSTLAGILSGRNAGFAGSVEVGGVPIQEASRASLGEHRHGRSVLELPVQGERALEPAASRPPGERRGAVGGASSLPRRGVRGAGGQGSMQR